MHENTYIGVRRCGVNDWHQNITEDRIVTVNGEKLPMTRRAKQHSPTGFEWGYGGSGPSALAHAIIAYEFTQEFGAEAAESFADEVYMDFKDHFVAQWDSNTEEVGDVPQWTLSSATVLVFVQTRHEKEYKRFKEGKAYGEERDDLGDFLDRLLDI